MPLDGLVASKNHSGLGYKYSRFFVSGSGMFPGI
jgi:hypothetical protein